MREKQFKVICLTFIITVISYLLLYIVVFLKKSGYDSIEYEVLEELLKTTPEAIELPYLVEDYKGRHVVIVESLDKKQRVAVMLNPKGNVHYKQFPAETNYTLKNEIFESWWRNLKFYSHEVFDSHLEQRHKTE